jgi:ATP phosphoribosyltransferase
MHIRREIDNILDKMNDLIANKKLSNKDKEELQNLKDEINKKTNNGERAKGMWTESPEFLAN